MSRSPITPWPDRLLHDVAHGRTGRLASNTMLTFDWFLLLVLQQNERWEPSLLDSLRGVTTSTAVRSSAL